MYWSASEGSTVKVEVASIWRSLITPSFRRMSGVEALRFLMLNPLPLMTPLKTSAGVKVFPSMSMSCEKEISSPASNTAAQVSRKYCRSSAFAMLSGISGRS